MGALKDAASVIKHGKPKLYCWEFIKCGREAGGNNAADLESDRLHYQTLIASQVLRPSGGNAFNSSSFLKLEG